LMGFAIALPILHGAHAKCLPRGTGFATLSRTLWSYRWLCTLRKKPADWASPRVVHNADVM